MKLVSCHIENFGKLQNFDYSFDDEKSIIHEDNGWGKSTLATFIRVMFYGFIGENKRNIIDNERKKFKPWQMGTYGGNVVFAVNGKEYRIERRFGDKKSGSDEFVLYDNTTNLKSDDYSYKIGEELFGIDIESFMRTVFIAQQDCSTDVTPNISAKIGNVSDQTADMGNYDAVQNALKDEMNNLTPDRVTGKLNKLSMRMSELNEKIANKENYLTNLTEYEKRLKEQEKAKEKKQEEKQTVQKKLEQVSVLKDSQAGVERYKELCEQEANAKQKYDNDKAFFPNDVPDENEIDSKLKRCNEYEKCIQTVENFLLTDDESMQLSSLEAIFIDGVPDDSEFDYIEENIDKLSELVSERDTSLLSDVERKKFDEADKLLKNYKPSLDEIDDLSNNWGERKSKKEVLSSKKMNAELFKNANNSSGTINKARGLILIIFGIVAVLGGVIAIVSTNSIALGGTIAVVGIALFIVGTILSVGKNNPKQGDDNSAYEQLLDEIASDELFIQRVEQACKDMFDKLGLQYNELDVPTQLTYIRGAVKDYDELADRSHKSDSTSREEEIKALITTITVFFQKYQQNDVDYDYKKLLYKLKTNALDYERIKSKQDNMKNASQKRDTIAKEVKEYIRSLGFEPVDDFKDQLSSINRKLISLNYSSDELNSISIRKENFEKNNDVTKFISIDSTTEIASMEELNKSFNELNEEIEKIEELENSFRQQMDDTVQKLEELDSYEVELESLKDDYNTGMRKYNIIGKTKEYLEMAKQNFSKKYMGEIKDSFEKYHNMISASADKYELDANLNIKLIEKGSLHEIEYLSEGYKDLVGLCRRMAMVDAMYDMEKPFLIFDDPFVNLDESRLAGAMKFLDNIAKDYQVIYFSCHKSRC